MPTPTTPPERVFTICMGQEPASLFPYGDSSVSARAVRQALYDGPQEIRQFGYVPVILSESPDFSNQGAVLEPVQSPPGSLIVDVQGNLVSLGEGVTYLPAGCTDVSCAQTFTGQEPAAIDQLVVRFKLRSELRWSDGEALTADDSLYSYEVARQLYPRVRYELLQRTQSYLALDETTLEWRGVPGYRDSSYAGFFFIPLPRHAWGSLTAADLLTAEASNRRPLGWGPYVLEEWTVGDHITLARNPGYFRAAEGLPRFDHLVFRFMSSAQEALQALQVGECDYVDETLALDAQGPELNAQLLELQDAGRVSLIFEVGTAVEYAYFGVQPVSTTPQADGSPAAQALFTSREVRQAVAQCIDRPRMSAELFFGHTQVADSYLTPGHPLLNAEARKYGYDPAAAAALLDSTGWLDTDGDPATARQAVGVAGVADGTPFEFTFLTSDEAEKQAAANILQQSLAQCGIKVNIQALPWNELAAPGPDGPVFGRKFQMAQLGWVTAMQPPCFLFLSREIPGPPPQSLRGWGGANASGYSNPSFDQACLTGINATPGSQAYRDGHLMAQAIFAEDLPAIPLYLRLKLVVTRPDLCNVTLDPSSESALSNLEAFDYGSGCLP